MGEMKRQPEREREQKNGRDYNTHPPRPSPGKTGGTAGNAQSRLASVQAGSRQGAAHAAEAWPQSFLLLFRKLAPRLTRFCQGLRSPAQPTQCRAQRHRIPFNAVRRRSMSTHSADIAVPDASPLPQYKPI